MLAKLSTIALIAVTFAVTEMAVSSSADAYVRAYRGGAYHGGAYRGGVYRGGVYRGGVYRGGVYRGGVYREEPWWSAGHTTVAFGMEPGVAIGADDGGLMGSARAGVQARSVTCGFADDGCNRQVT